MIVCAGVNVKECLIISLCIRLRAVVEKYGNAAIPVNIRDNLNDNEFVLGFRKILSKFNRFV
jgi:hypothetical protein